MSLLRQKLVITGPTGTGKTAYVNRLLDTFPFEAINMDSCQVYAFFRVGTGRGDGEHRAARHLYGFLEPAGRLSVDAYVERAVAVTREVELHGGLPLFEGGSRSLLPALSQALPLKIIGLRPPQTPGWIEAKMAQRVEGFFAGGAIVREVEAALRFGYGDCALMRDPMIYMQTRDYLAGRYTLAEVKRLMIASMKAMHDDQLRCFEAMDIEWWDVESATPDDLARRVARWLGEQRARPMLWRPTAQAVP